MTYTDSELRTQVIPVDVPQSPDLHIDGELFIVSSDDQYVVTMVVSPEKGIGKHILAFVDRGIAVECARKIGDGSMVRMKDQLDIGMIAKTKRYCGYAIVMADEIKHIWI